MSEAAGGADRARSRPDSEDRDHAVGGSATPGADRAKTRLDPEDHAVRGSASEAADGQDDEDRATPRPAPEDRAARGAAGRESMREAAAGQDDEDDDEELPIACLAPARPPALTWSVILLAAVVFNGAPFVGLLAILAAQELCKAIGIPSDFGVVSGIGFVVLLGAVLVVLLHAYQTRYRAAWVDDRGLILGVLGPPRGWRLHWFQISGFRIREDGVVLRVRRRPWTRFVGPVVTCNGLKLHRVAERLERHGVRRLDG